MAENILIIDDDPSVHKSVSDILGDENYNVYKAEDAVIGLNILTKERINLVILDVLLPKIGGLEALEKIRSLYPKVEVVVMSGHANIDMAVKATRLGAFDFLEKPFSLEKILTICNNALTVQRLREENLNLKKKTGRKNEMIGKSAKIEEVKRLIEQAAASDARILITGENGVGKELVARAIHFGSSRSEKNFVEVNCAAIPDTLIESELFGHEKGAFTDAVSSRKGRFELATGGTLFLDEIGDMSLTAQAKVLRAIQEQKIEHIGGEKSIDVNVRIVAATNKDLLTQCNAGNFRQDLFFRLNVIPIYMPPLRERKDDVMLLLFHFLQELGDGAEFQFDESAISFLENYNWPGNVRELRNLAERILVMHAGGNINGKILLNLLQKNPTKANFKIEGLSEIMDLDYNSAKEAFEKQYLTYQLSKNGGVISQTAEAIGMYPSNLHAKLSKYKMKDK